MLCQHYAHTSTNFLKQDTAWSNNTAVSPCYSIHNFNSLMTNFCTSRYHRKRRFQAISPWIHFECVVHLFKQAHQGWNLVNNKKIRYFVNFCLCCRRPKLFVDYTNLEMYVCRNNYGTFVHFCCKNYGKKKYVRYKILDLCLSKELTKRKYWLRKIFSNLGSKWKQRRI